MGGQERNAVMTVDQIYKFIEECPNNARVLVDTEKFLKYGDKWQDIPMDAIKVEYKFTDAKQDQPDSEKQEDTHDE